MANDPPCLECGALGIAKDIVHCASCRINGVHRYCMVEWPKTKLGHVRWFCGCEEAEDLHKQSKFTARDEELSNQSRKKKSCVSEQIRSKFMAKNDEEFSTQSEIKWAKSSSETSPIQPQIPPQSEKKDEELSSKSKTKEVANSSSGTNQIRQRIRPKFMKSFTSYGNLFGPGKPAEPMIRSVWSGSFHIPFMYDETARRSIDGLSAFLSNKADQKAWEKMVRFGPVIRPEMVLKDLVWPKSFEETGPKDENVAVYFFPSVGEDEKVYDCLVNDMLHDDLALRVGLENVEILIFTSVDLISRLRRFQGKWYLWGLLRQNHGKDEHHSLSGPDLCSSC